MHILLFLSLSISFMFPGKDGEGKKEDLSQTESYLKVIPLEQVGKKLDITNIERYKPLIKTFIKSEKAHPDHYALYHGASLNLLPFFMLNTKLQFLSDKYKNEFVFLRTHSEFFLEVLSSSEFLAKYHQDIDDREDEWGTILFSTNLSFPGNLVKLSSSLHYVDKNHSQLSTTKISRLFDKLVSNDDLLSKYLQCKIQLLLSQLQTRDHGIVLQILIPKKIIDYCAYLCTPRGEPLRVKIPNIEQGWDQSKNYYILISPILEALQKNPEKIKEVLPHLQARIKLDSKFFSNPESGVTIYIHHMIDNETYRVFDQEIEKIANNILLHRFCTILDVAKPLPFKYIAMPDIISTAAVAYNNDYWFIHNAGLKLFEELFQRGKGFSQAIDTAKTAFIDKDLLEIKVYFELPHEGPGFKLFRKLFKHGQGFSQAISAATTAVNNPYIGYSGAVRRKEGINLLMELVKHNQGIGLARTTVNNILNPPLWKRILGLDEKDTSVLEKAQELSKLIEEKKRLQAKL